MVSVIIIILLLQQFLEATSLLHPLPEVFAGHLLGARFSKGTTQLVFKAPEIDPKAGPEDHVQRYPTQGQARPVTLRTSQVLTLTSR